MADMDELIAWLDEVEAGFATPNEHCPQCGEIGLLLIKRLRVALEEIEEQAKSPYYAPWARDLAERIREAR